MVRAGTLWVDKHRPTQSSALRYNADIASRLTRLASSGDIPHLLLYGPSGAGKRTLVTCLLRSLYGPSVEKRKVSHCVYKVGDPKKDVELTVVSSPSHIEVNPSDCGNNDRLIVQQLIKDMASVTPIDIGQQLAGVELDADDDDDSPAFKTIVLNEVDQMSRLAQQALRRTMEKYAKTCRIIMVAESSTKVLEPLRSRCLGVRVPLPTRTELCDVMSNVADREGTDISSVVMGRIADQPGINTRRALLQLESLVICNGSVVGESATVQRADWEDFCREIALKLTQKQSVDQLVAVRKLFLMLLGHAVPEDVILRRVVLDILGCVDDEIAPAICSAAAKFDLRLAKGSKPIFHLEAFAARFMQIYADYLAGMQMAD